jgi:hypothetical protein
VKRDKPLDRLMGVCARAVMVGAALVGGGVVLAIALPRHELPFTLVPCALGVWLVLVGEWGRRKAQRSIARVRHSD